MRDVADRGRRRRHRARGRHTYGPGLARTLLEFGKGARSPARGSAVGSAMIAAPRRGGKRVRLGRARTTARHRRGLSIYRAVLHIRRAEFDRDGRRSAARSSICWKTAVHVRHGRRQVALGLAHPLNARRGVERHEAHAGRRGAARCRARQNSVGMAGRRAAPGETRVADCTRQGGPSDVEPVCRADELSSSATATSTGAPRLDGIHARGRNWARMNRHARRC
jgi:hypothetical protein